HGVDECVVSHTTGGHRQCNLASADHVVDLVVAASRYLCTPVLVQAVDETHRLDAFEVLAAPGLTGVGVIPAPRLVEVTSCQKRILAGDAPQRVEHVVRVPERAGVATSSMPRNRMLAFPSIEVVDPKAAWTRVRAHTGDATEGTNSDARGCQVGPVVA